MVGANSYLRKHQSKRSSGLMMWLQRFLGILSIVALYALYTQMQHRSLGSTGSDCPPCELSCPRCKRCASIGGAAVGKEPVDKELRSHVLVLEREVKSLRKEIERMRYAESRRRSPQFRGPFPLSSSMKPGTCDLGWAQQWDCVPTSMRYEFTMGGKIGVDWREPKPDEGRPNNGFSSGSVSDTQLPRKMVEQKLMKYTAAGNPIWTKEVVDTLVKEVKEGRDISCQDYPDSATDVSCLSPILNFNFEFNFKFKFKFKCKVSHVT